MGVARSWYVATDQSAISDKIRLVAAFILIYNWSLPFKLVRKVASTGCRVKTANEENARHI
jgi:hypothetical protein